MALTVNSGSASYCTVAQFLQRYDARTIGDLLDDTGNRVASSSITGNAIIAALLMQNSGKLEAAVLIGERYTVTDLTALTVSSTNMQEFIAGIVAALTIESVYRRRPNPDQVNFPETDEAERLLNALADGKRIFGFTETMVAGHIDSETETKETVEARNMATFNKGEKLFGRRNNRLDPR